MPCVCEFGKHFQNSLGSRGSGCLCHLCNTKDSKGKCVASIVRESGKHSQKSLSSGGDVFLCYRGITSDSWKPSKVCESIICEFGKHS